jgi:hypothetical protein
MRPDARAESRIWGFFVAVRLSDLAQEASPRACRWPHKWRAASGPESYVADNDYLSFVSMNKALFAGVRDAAKAFGRR